MTATYYLSADDRISHFKPSNDRGIATIGVADLPYRLVDGHLIWRFVAGHDTRSFMNALFFHARRQMCRLELPTRCVAGDQFAHFRMELKPYADGSLKVSHDFEGNSAFDYAAPRLDEALDPYICSNCASLRLSGVWWTQSALGGDDFAAKRMTVCSTCRARARAAISAAMPVVHFPATVQMRAGVH